MNRIFKALGALALALVMTLSLACAGVFAAAQPSVSQPSSSGYLVTLKQDRPAADDASVIGTVLGGSDQAVLMAAQYERAELAPLAPELGIYKANTLSDIQNLVWSGQVELVEPDYAVELFDLDIHSPTTPNDDYFTTRNAQFNLKNVNVQSAWDAGLTGQGVTVAVIDSGLNASHLDAPVKVARGRYYYYREDENGSYSFTVNGVTKKYGYYSSDDTSDNIGHGSMVAGIVAANTNNASASYTGGVAGMAPNVTILPIRCFTNTAGHLGGYSSNLISGINYAVANGADIINMSWGLTSESATLKNAIDNAAKAGCILIAAAGNDGAATRQYPAAWDNVIGVGSTDAQGRLTSYSQRNDTVNICAPGGSSGGQQVYSLWYDSTTAIGRGAGTSFSAPVVTGAAALLKEHAPSMNQADFLALLRDNSDFASIAEKDKPYAGYGQLDMKKLLQAVGHTGAMVRYNEDDSLTARAAYFPAGESAPANLLVLIGAYNPAGHLLGSQIATASRSAYGAYSLTTDFQLPEAATLKAFFLDTATLAALDVPVTMALSQ